METIRILQVFGEPLSNGGQESFVMNMYRNIDKNKFQFDFFTPFYCDNLEMKKNIEDMGGKVFFKNKEFYSKKRKKYFTEELKKFLKENKYNIVHIHSGSIFSLAYGAKIANKRGVKSVIVHSHATGIKNLKYKIIRILSNNKMKKYVSRYLACSKIAAIWKYPKSIIKAKKYKVINNGIDVEKFKFNETVRQEYREKLNIKENIVLCNVGRFTEEKNHILLIDIMEKIVPKHKNIKLLLVGTGVLENKIKQLVKEKNLEENVIFLGNRHDVNNILQAVDMFLFPSIFEGLGIVAIEAQTAGLNVICSEKIPEDINLTKLVHRVSLEKGVEPWCTIIEKCIKEDINRENFYKIVDEKGYSDKKCAKVLENIYEEESKK